MTRFAIRGLLSRKLRTALTAIAIVLGVAMISGTYVLTDSIDQAFDKIFTDIRKGSSAVITGRSAFDLSDGSGVTDPTLDEDLLGEVRELPSVAQAEGSVDSDATQLIGDDGKAIVSGGAPNLGFSIASGDSDFNPLTLVDGAWPGPEEVVVDKETAVDQDFEVGETIGVQAEGPVERVRISGVVEFGSGLTIGGATLAGFDLPTAQRRLLISKLRKLKHELYTPFSTIVVLTNGRQIQQTNSFRRHRRRRPIKTSRRACGNHRLRCPWLSTGRGVVTRGRGPFTNRRQRFC